MTKIYYFSGTGNTLWSARKLADLIGGECELFNIGVEAQKEAIKISASAVILLFPSYAYGLPILVRRFAQKAMFDAPYIAAFVTYGTSPGGTLAELCRILKKKRINSAFFGNIPSVENYIAIFGPQKAKTIERRIGMQKQATEIAAKVIKEKKTNRINTFRPFSSFISFLFSLGLATFYKSYRVSPDCNACGICERICPVAAITIQNSKPVFHKNCEHCQACLNWCPKCAIHFGRLNSKTPRYHHPEISIADISRSVSD